MAMTRQAMLDTSSRATAGWCFTPSPREAPVSSARPCSLKTLSQRTCGVPRVSCSSIVSLEAGGWKLGAAGRRSNPGDILLQTRGIPAPALARPHAWRTLPHHAGPAALSFSCSPGDSQRHGGLLPLSAHQVQADTDADVSNWEGFPVLGLTPGWESYALLSPRQRARLHNHIRAVAGAAPQPITVEQFGIVYSAFARECLEGAEDGSGEGGAGALGEAAEVEERVSAAVENLLGVLQAVPNVVHQGSLQEQGLVVLTDTPKNQRAVRAIGMNLRGQVLVAAQTGLDRVWRGRVSAGAERCQGLTKQELRESLVGGAFIGPSVKEPLVACGYALGDTGLRRLVTDMADMLEMRWVPQDQPQSLPESASLADAPEELVFMYPDAGAALTEVDALFHVAKEMFEDM